VYLVNALLDSLIVHNEASRRRRLLYDPLSEVQVINERGRSQSVSSLTGVLSNVLGFARSCDQIDNIRRSTRQAIAVTLDPTLPGETTQTFEADNLATVGQRVFTDGVAPSIIVLG
jgi:hypothetical protein